MNRGGPQEPGSSQELFYHRVLSEWSAGWTGQGRRQSRHMSPKGTMGQTTVKPISEELQDLGRLEQCESPYLNNCPALDGPLQAPCSQLEPLRVRMKKVPLTQDNLVWWNSPRVKCGETDQVCEPRTAWPVGSHEDNFCSVGDDLPNQGRNQRQRWKGIVKTRRPGETESVDPFRPWRREPREEARKLIVQVCGEEIYGWDAEPVANLMKYVGMNLPLAVVHLCPAQEIRLCVFRPRNVVRSDGEEVLFCPLAQAK
ncbi:uncharacterized protein [Pituophis catenifer annectens]|uniref:uncharacterized protein n=1 Tax=Pituophis catenifer annectens TaxID=94852 RepID=UPI003993BF65